MMDVAPTPTPNKRLWAQALALGVFTIVYNLAEGLVATAFGFRDESLTLFGFGLDSFIEVISAIGIVHLMVRLARHGEAHRDRFEKVALKVTGWAFYLLVALLLANGIYNIYQHKKPETAFWGLVISGVSMAFMGFLIWAKTAVGRALNSQPVLADAACSRVCLYMSGVLLLSSGVYAVTGFAWTDTLGAVALAWFSFKEGRECFEKAQKNVGCGCENESCQTPPGLGPDVKISGAIKK